jgi:hypothetical protein
MNAVSEKENKKENKNNMDRIINKIDNGRGSIT